MAPEGVVYWDASAVLSALVRDAHSDEAAEWAASDRVHLISSLACAEVSAVLERARRERRLADVLVDAAYEARDDGPWRRVSVDPDRSTIRDLARRWPLRGADLWHLATAITLRTELAELVLLTFDARLDAAAQGEGLAT